MKVVGIIPARGGSKGIPGKNIKKILGKPLLCYTIEAALSSKMIDKIYVSSDYDEILEVANEYKGIDLHKRAKTLATDTSSVTETIFDIINKTKERFDIIALLQPTSPIRTGKQIDEAILLLKENDTANSIVSVVGMDDTHPARMYWKVGGILQPIMPDLENKRRQDIPVAYYRNGSIYAVKSEAFLREGTIMAKPMLSYEMPISQLLNIDIPRDVIAAEALINAWQNGELL